MAAVVSAKYDAIRPVVCCDDVTRLMVVLQRHLTVAIAA